MGGSQGQEIETILANTMKPRLYWKYKKISQGWWRAPVVPAAREAEAVEWCKPGRWSLQWAEIRPLRSSLGDRARLRLKKKKEKKSFSLYYPSDKSFPWSLRFEDLDISKAEEKDMKFSLRRNFGAYFSIIGSQSQ